MDSVYVEFHKTTVGDLIDKLLQIKDRNQVLTEIADGDVLHFQLPWCIGRVVAKDYERKDLYLIVDENQTKWILHDKSTVSKKTHLSPGPIYNAYEYYPMDEIIAKDDFPGWIASHTKDSNMKDEYGFGIGVKLRRRIGHGDWSLERPEWDDEQDVVEIVGSTGSSWKLSNNASIDKLDTHYERGSKKLVWYEIETDETKKSYEAQLRRTWMTCPTCKKLFNPKRKDVHEYEEEERYDHGNPWGIMGQNYWRCPYCKARWEDGPIFDTGKNIPGTIAYYAQGGE